MIDWLKNISNNYPDFWKIYVSKFDKKSNRFVALSLETSGLNKNLDSIISIGAVAIIDNSLVIKDNFEIVLNSNFSNQESSTTNLDHQAIEKFVNFIENAVLVGHRISFDVDIINEYLEKLKCGRLKNDALDIEVMYKRLEDINDQQFTLDELAKKFRISKSERYSASEDAYTIGLLFLKLKSRLKIK